MKFIKLLKEAQVHGVVRLAERRWRWLWIIAIFLLLSCAIGCVIVTIDRFLGTPTYITRQESSPINIPFPSVIVCPELDYPDYKMDEFLSELKYPSGINATYIRSILRQLGAYFSPDVGYKVQDLDRLEYLLVYNDIDVETAARWLTPSCEEILIKCRWRNNLINCSSMFLMELTGDGFCCVFNGRSLTREIREFGIIRKKPAAKWFTSSIGFTSGVVIAVNQSQKLNNVDRSYKWLALQNSQHFMETTMNGTPLNPGYEQWIGYVARGFQITEEARSLSDDMRRCRLASEPLKFFPYYISYESNECDCPRTCDANDFHVITSSNKLTNVAFFDPFYAGLDFTKVTVVRVYVQRRSTIANSLRCYFSAYDLFAQLGGVFNVFFGCSILTILELIQLTWHGTKAWIKTRNKNKRKTKGLILANGFEKKKAQKKSKNSWKITEMSRRQINKRKAPKVK